MLSAKPKAVDNNSDNTYRELDYSGYHKKDFFEEGNDKHTITKSTAWHCSWKSCIGRAISVLDWVWPHFLVWWLDRPYVREKRKIFKALYLFPTRKYPWGKFAQIKMLNVGWFIITVRWYYTNLLSSRISAQHKITKLIWSAKIKGNIYALKPFNASCCLVFRDVGLYLQSLSFLLTKIFW